MSPSTSSGVTVPNGNYIIYCRTLSPTGSKLAITFEGSGALATVRPLGYTENQIVRRTVVTYFFLLMYASNLDA